MDEDEDNSAGGNGNSDHKDANNDQEKNNVILIEWVVSRMGDFFNFDNRLKIIHSDPIYWKFKLKNKSVRQFI